MYCGVVHACMHAISSGELNSPFVCLLAKLPFPFFLGGGGADMWIFPYSKPPIFSSLTFMRFANLQYVKFVHILYLLLHILFFVYNMFLVLFYITIIRFTYAFVFSVALHNFYFILFYFINCCL